jgi:hypothetical protein
MIGRATQSAPLQKVAELIGQSGGFIVDTALCARRLLVDICRNCIGGRGRDLSCAAAAATMYESVSNHGKDPLPPGGLQEGKESIEISHGN